jgi:hypothetical protein
MALRSSKDQLEAKVHETVCSKAVMLEEADEGDSQGLRKAYRQELAGMLRLRIDIAKLCPRSRRSNVYRSE